MAFLKRTWLARIGQGLNKFLIGEKDAQGKQTLTNSPDSVTQEGDVISADNLNDLEDRIEVGLNSMKLTKVWENPNPSAEFPATTINFSPAVQEVIISYSLAGSGNPTDIGFYHIKFVGTTSPDNYGLSRIDVDSESLSVTTRTVSSTIMNGQSYIQFGDARIFGVMNTSPVQTAILEVNDVLVPLAIYKVGDIYNS